MRDSVIKFSLNMQSLEAQVQVSAKSGDTARRLEIVLTDGGRPYTIDPGMSAVMMIRKPDNNVIFNDCTIRLADSVVIYQLTEQSIASVGLADCELRLYGVDDDLITSPRFTMLVKAAVVEDSEVESVSEFTALTEALSAANRLDIDVSKDGHVTTVSITHPDDTTEEAEILDGASITSATAEIDSTQGDPSVEVTIEDGETDFDKTLKFLFSGLKGETGPQGEAATIESVSATVDNNTGTPMVFVTEGGTSAHKTISFAFENLKGDQGYTGEIGEKGEQGEQGEQGVSITSVTLIAGTHAPGTNDTYRISMDNGTHTDFTVYNGANGIGAGDMLASVYDPNNRLEAVAFASDLTDYDALADGIDYNGDGVINLKRGNTVIDTITLSDKADLDTNGRVPYSQLPETAMEYKGNWDADQNIPELVSGVGTNGDLYVVSVAGTFLGVDYEVNDRIIFDGTSGEWARLAAGNNTVIRDDLLHQTSQEALSANQGYVLKGLIDTLLGAGFTVSDDTLIVPNGAGTISDDTLVLSIF